MDAIAAERSRDVRQAGGRDLLDPERIDLSAQDRWPVGVRNPDSSCRGSVILADETAEHIASTDLARIDGCRITLLCLGNGQRERPVWSLAVVVLRVGAKH